LKGAGVAQGCNNWESIWTHPKTEPTLLYRAVIDTVDELAVD
jgi:hypothetical protein